MENNAKQTWTNPNRNFPPGPWDAEPCKQQWVDAATGLDCLAVRNPGGAWCGYVGVPTGHPCFEKSYSVSIPALGSGHARRMKQSMPDTPDMGLMIAALSGKLDEVTMSTAIDVHGGVTFTDRCREHGDAEPWRGVCHVPLAGRGEVWWIGFDCAHAGDLSPTSGRWGIASPGDAYRTLAYVEEQCAGLARQLAEAGKP